MTAKDLIKKVKRAILGEIDWEGYYKLMEQIPPLEYCPDCKGVNKFNCFTAFGTIRACKCPGAIIRGAGGYTFKNKISRKDKL